MERILLLGYFGAGNFGDDALLVDWLKKQHGWMESRGMVAGVVNNGLDPLAGFAEGDELRDLIDSLIPRRRALSMPLGGYRALVAPGGSLLQDSTSVRSLLYYLWVMRRFLRAGKPVYLLNQGIGPLSSWLASYLTPRYLKGVKLLTLRDSESYAWANGQRLLEKHPEVRLSADPLLSAQFAAPPGMKSEADLAGGYALVIPRRSGDLPTAGDETTEEAALGRLLSHAAQITDLKQILAPLHRGQDQEFCEAVSTILPGETVVFKAGDKQQHYANAIWGLIAGASLVISYRLHGLVCAAAHGIPALGVAYDPKVVSFCTEVGYPYCFPATVHEQSSLDDLERLWSGRAAVLDELAVRRKKMLERLKLSEERFYSLWEES
ncbi:polysaccharide pyruvyl transferase family protein [bacterium]|nr:polysaccharide pyruvyl transferase family protein [bacterium]